jgi:hypothetical protein
VTVCTNDLALVDLTQDVRPSTRSQARRDGENLVGQVVELEHDRVRLSAIDTGPLAKELDEELHPFGEMCFAAALCVRDVALPVREVVLAFVLRPTWAAVGVSLP